MKSVDIIIISDSKSQDLINVTINGIETLYRSETGIEFYTYIVESTKGVDYSYLHKNIRMVEPNPPFGYHKYLNIGRKLGKSKYVCLCNNDLEFSPGWASSLISEMEKDPDLLSASPISYRPHIFRFDIKTDSGNQYGYEVRKHIAGYCIFQKRDIYNIIGDLDESFAFWYCDNDYAMELKTRKIKHALVTSSRVDHKISKTLSTKKDKERDVLTKMQQAVFNKKWNIKNKNDK
jgi:GT2 family glycosyltransferase